MIGELCLYTNKLKKKPALIIVNPPLDIWISTYPIFPTSITIGHFPNFISSDVLYYDVVFILTNLSIQLGESISNYCYSVLLWH